MQSLLSLNRNNFSCKSPRSFLFAVVAAIIGFLFTMPAHAADAFLRVNLVGYEPGRSADAYLMTKAPISNATYKITRSGGKAVITGTVGPTSGAWGDFTIYPIHFKLDECGTYKVEVSGDVSAKSPEFKVDLAINLYSTALANSLSFYQNERDGKDYIASQLRTAPGHLNDKKASVYQTPPFDDDDNMTTALVPTGATIDASGGWWDAGDYLKFVQTHSYTVALMLIGVRDFPAQMGHGSGSDFTDEAKFGLDWLQKMWDDKTRTLYYQVGIGTDFTNFPYLSDHDIWRLPQADDTYAGTDPTFQYIRNRPVFIAAPAGSKISPNLAGRLAADFALCYKVFRWTDTSYANKCLKSAEHVYDLADTSPSSLLTVAPNDFYPESEWRDDMELGATELYFALRDGGQLPNGLDHSDASYYLKQAASWAHAYITGPSDASDTLNLYDVSGLAHFDLYRALLFADDTRGLAVTRADLKKDIAHQLETASAQAKDPFGYGWTWSFGDSVSHGGGISVMADELHAITGAKKYGEDSRRWMGNILGANPWGLSFIVDDGSKFPYCMQHQVANILGSTDGAPPVLSGAAVEGPTDAATSGLLDGMVTCPPGGGNVYKKFNGNGAVYKDNVQSYSTDEPAIDLTSTSFLMFAWKIAGQPWGIP